MQIWHAKNIKKKERKNNKRWSTEKPYIVELEVFTGSTETTIVIIDSSIECL